MSDELPFHIQGEIIMRLPVKSLIQFRSVSKAWKSLIDSAEFVAAQSVLHTHPHHLFVWYKDPRGEVKYVSFVDDDSFPQQRFVPTLPLSVKLPRIVGSSHGLLCLDGYHWDPETSKINFKKRLAVVCNPSIRKSIAFVVPDILYARQEIVLAFGVCPVTIDPKIIQITQLPSWMDKKTEISNLWKVEVYSFSSGKWKSLSTNLPSNSIRIRQPQVVIDRYIYWCSSCIDSGLRTHNLIMSFDMTDESFKVVDIPDSLASHPFARLSISKLGESLVMLEYNINTEEQVRCDVWMMENGVQVSFTKLYTIKGQRGSIKAVGFRKTGGPIMEVDDYLSEPTQLVVYEPNSGHCNDPIRGYSFNVNSYMETLLMFGRSDCSSY
ncbi:unnamed protein product [Lactuca virosa]|uniref:F-box domain-containing protein n=1 Tax=Lactuca virosa TaxID=75947 RepID=A0AAU9NDW5_9ASTR|nr:unnamed protein product [Lactuca virosa]